jgi:hypothetical protein
MKVLLIIFSLSAIGGTAYYLWYDSSSQRMEREVEKTQKTIDALQDAMDATQNIIRLQEEIDALEN